MKKTLMIIDLQNGVCYGDKTLYRLEALHKFSAQSGEKSAKNPT